MRLSWQASWERLKRYFCIILNTKCDYATSETGVYQIHRNTGRETRKAGLPIASRIYLAMLCKAIRCFDRINSIADNIAHLASRVVMRIGLI